MSSDHTIEVNHDPDHRRVDVTVDGDPFTSYLYDAAILTKPVCYPIRSAGGTQVERGYPIDPRPYERVDHPHHVGFWFNYGHVNGLDFWNAEGEDRDGFGYIRLDSIEQTSDGSVGTLVTTAEWCGPDGTCHLREETTFVFRARNDERSIDRKTTLTAEQDVDLRDDKEGMLALRVRRELEHPSDGTTRLTDENGEPMSEPSAHSEGVNGEYLSSNGVRGTDVWGTRARWMALSGAVDDEDLTVVLMDHPDNVGYPTHWHARGYGLFAANPLGQSILSDDEEELDFELEARESTTFRHRLSIASDTPYEDRIDERYDAFVDDAP